MVLAAFFGGVTKLIPGLNGDGQILRSGVQQDLNEEKRPGTSGDYKALGSGLFIIAYYLFYTRLLYQFSNRLP